MNRKEKEAWYSKGWEDGYEDALLRSIGRNLHRIALRENKTPKEITLEALKMYFQDMKREIKDV